MKKWQSNLAILVSVTFFSFPLRAVSEPSFEFDGTSTRITFAPEFSNTLKAQGIELQSVSDSQLSIVSNFIVFPITRAAIDFRTLEGEVLHTGGLRFRKGGVTVDLNLPIVDTTRPRNIVMTGLVHVNDSVINRFTVFRVNPIGLVPPSTSLPTSLVTGRYSITNSDVRLTYQLARTLNSAFATRAFVSNARVGSARVDLTGGVRSKNLGR